MTPAEDPFVIELKSSGTRVLVDADEQTFLSRNKYWIALGAGLGLVFVLLLYLLLHDSSKSQAAQLLVRPANELGNISSQVANSPSLDQLNKIGDRTARFQGIVDRAQLKAAKISNDEVRVATIALLDAENDALRAYQGLDDVGRPGSPRALKVIDRTKRAVRDIKIRISALKLLELDETLSPYPRESLLNRALRRLESLLGR